MRKLLTVDAKLRPTLPELMKDLWIQGQETPEAIKFLLRLCCVLPAEKMCLWRNKVAPVSEDS